MEIYILIILFFVGVFITNSIPHFVNGVSGRKFPTPFAHPRGIGLSSPLVNVIWGFSNIIIACLLFNLIGVIKIGLNFESLALFLGAFCISYISAKHFGALKLS